MDVDDETFDMDLAEDEEQLDLMSDDNDVEVIVPSNNAAGLGSESDVGITLSVLVNGKLFKLVNANNGTCILCNNNKEMTTANRASNLTKHLVGKNFTTKNERKIFYFLILESGAPKESCRISQAARSGKTVEAEGQRKETKA